MNTYNYLCTPELMQMLKHFYLISGLRVGIYDAELNCITDYPAHPDAYEDLHFCDKIRYHNDAYTERCFACDRQAFAHICKTKRTYIYTCYEGFTEALIPILYEDSVAYVLMVGRVRNAAITDATFERIVTNYVPTEQLEQERDVLREAFAEIPRIDPHLFESYVYFLELCAQSIYEHRYVRMVEKSIVENFKDYVHENLFNMISIWDAASALSISTSHLSRLLTRDLGMSFTEYVTEQKIEKAKELLLTEDSSVSEIAYLLQFQDPNYFMRVFKKKTGLTCTAFRKSRLKK